MGDSGGMGERDDGIGMGDRYGGIGIGDLGALIFGVRGESMVELGRAGAAHREETESER